MKLLSGNSNKPQQKIAKYLKTKLVNSSIRNLPMEKFILKLMKI